MPPRRKNQKNELDRMSVLAKKLGMNIDNLLEEVPLTEIGEDAQIRHEIEAESVIFFIETKGKGFQQKVCANPNCGGLFLHTYSAVAYCSDTCRAWQLAQYGIIWNFHRRSLSQRWNAKGKGFVPKVIGVEATAALVEQGYVTPEIEAPGPIKEAEEEEYVPEVPYDPNFKLSSLKEHADVDEQEIIEAEERLKELRGNG
jgi:hypothetical protein